MTPGSGAYGAWWRPRKLRLAGARARWAWSGLALCWFASAARADGAFADSKVVMLPRTQPHRILAASDLPGLIVSDDDGASWSWICEDAIGHFAALFQLGPAPAENLYAITREGLAISSDHGCSWQHADGVAKRAGDAFPDPNDPRRVLTIANMQLDPDSPVLGDVLVESNDSGRTFGAALYSTSQASLTGVEVARSDPSTIYLTMSSLELQHPYIARSSDAGATWLDFDVSGGLGRRPSTLRILAVDPQASETLYIRASDGIRDALAITRDGGMTLQIARQLDAKMTAFLLRSDGALIVASEDKQSFISSDGGASFTPWSHAFQISALAERAGVLYATATSRDDGFAFATSRDGGAHWRSALRLEQVRGPLACGSVREQCQAAWQQLQPVLPALSGALRADDDDAGIQFASAAPRRPAANGCSIPQPLAANDHGAWLGLALGVALSRVMSVERARRLPNKETRS